jgi:hypothetical protein
MVAAKLFTVEIQIVKESSVQNKRQPVNTTKIVLLLKIQNVAASTLAFVIRTSAVTWVMLIARTDTFGK